MVAELDSLLMPNLLARFSNTSALIPLLAGVVGAEVPKR